MINRILGTVGTIGYGVMLGHMVWSSDTTVAEGVSIGSIGYLVMLACGIAFMVRMIWATP